MTLLNVLTIRCKNVSSTAKVLFDQFFVKDSIQLLDDLQLVIIKHYTYSDTYSLREIRSGADPHRFPPFYGNRSDFS